MLRRPFRVRDGKEDEVIEVGLNVLGYLVLYGPHRQEELVTLDQQDAGRLLSALSLLLPEVYRDQEVSDAG